MSKFLCFLLAIFTLHGVADASKGGGGGIVVACYKDGQLQSARLLDLYEGEVRGLKFSELTGNFFTDVENIAFKLTKNNNLAKNFVNGVTKMTSMYYLIPRDTELTLTNDAFPIFFPRGCKYQQVANFYNETTIWIDEVLFEKMSYRDKTALAVHEWLYYLERRNHVLDSRYARTITSLAFSTEDPFVKTKLKGATHFCSSGEDKKVIFYTKYMDNGMWDFDFDMINGHTIYSKKSATVKLSSSSSLGVSAGTNHLESKQTYHTAILESKINNGELLVVKSTADEIKVSWTGSDPGDAFQDVLVNCFQL